MIYGSVCSGIEAASVAWHPLGWRAEFFAEVEPSCSRFLSTTYPAVPNHGDLTKFEEWPHATIDVLVGGTPCQSFSVAGRRGGMDDPRGRLALSYVGLLDRLRPKWFVWENVPGVLSSSGGDDFEAFITAIRELGYGVVWRTLDARYFGVPQRRRRVFAVGYFGDWRPAAAVLLESSSVRRDSAARGEAREGVAGTLGARPQRSSADAAGQGLYVARSLRAQGNSSHREDSDNFVAMALNTRSSRLDAESQTMIASSLRASDGHHGHSSPRGDGSDNLVAEPLTAAYANTSSNAGNNPKPLNVYESRGGVRRLTPRECERLQGFPDDYTLPLGSDSARYRALGNSMAVPVMRWIGERIQKVSSIVARPIPIAPIVTCSRCGRMDCGEFGGCGPDPKVVKELQ